MVEALLVVVWVVHAVEAHEEEDVSAEEVLPRRQTPTVRGQLQDPGLGHPLRQQEQENTVQGRLLPLAADRGPHRHREVAGAEEGTTMNMSGDAAQAAAVPKAMVVIVVEEAARGIEEATAERYVNGVDPEKYLKGMIFETGYQK